MKSNFLFDDDFHFEKFIDDPTIEELDLNEYLNNESLNNSSNYYDNIENENDDDNEEFGKDLTPATIEYYFNENKNNIDSDENIINELFKEANQQLDEIQLSIKKHKHKHKHKHHHHHSKKEKNRNEEKQMKEIYKSFNLKLNKEIEQRKENNFLNYKRERNYNSIKKYNY
jgi:hypothetical protein